MTDAAKAAAQPSRQSEIDAKNASFWNELCGTALAKKLGVNDSSPESLKKFDDWYMDYYPYLYKHIPFEEMAGKKVLEVGLGYGTVSQQLALAGAEYSGLDIAAGPVAMVNHRLAQLGLKGKAVQGSVLEAPFPDNSFDWVIAIGCFHHTGNLQRALDEAWRMLKPGGKAMVMVYYAYSYRRWRNERPDTLNHFAKDKLMRSTARAARTDKERATYDKSTISGEGAPETAFASASDIRRMTKKWSKCRCYRENIGAEWIFKKWDRERACRLAGPWMGLDIYCALTK